MIARFSKTLGYGLKLAALSVVGLGLSACVTLLPEEKPAQLYRLSYNPALTVGDEIAPKTAEVADKDRYQVYLSSIDFPKDAASDRIKTVEDSEVSFIAHARWSAPAPDLFNDALSEGFDRSATRVHMSRQVRGASAFRLELKVRRFEVVYNRKRPTVSVSIDASITRVRDRKLVASRYITTDVGVAKSDVSMIVAAFEKATTEVVYGLIRFTEETAAKSESEQAAAKAAP